MLIKQSRVSREGPAPANALLYGGSRPAGASRSSLIHDPIRPISVDRRPRTRLTTRPAIMCGEEVLLDGEVIGTMTEARDATWRFWLAETRRARSLGEAWSVTWRAGTRAQLLGHLETAVEREVTR